MSSLSYTLSPSLREHLLEIETLKRKILLPPLSFDAEVSLRFDTLIQRILLLVKPDGFTKKQLADYLLFNQSAKQTIRQIYHSEERIDAYKEAYTYIMTHWHITPRHLTVSEVIKINQKIYRGKLQIDSDIMADLLTYLETLHDSPVVQSALALPQVMRLEPFSKQNAQMAHLIALLYLEKGGYNFRGLVFWEEQAYKESGTFKANLQDAMTRDNQTLWLEYVTEMLRDHLLGIVSRITQKRRSEGWKTELPIDDDAYSTWIPHDTVPISITERQRHILAQLDTPGARITNKMVQALFHISQITASRDLSQLERLSLVTQHGKGRSIYYTRSI